MSWALSIDRSDITQASLVEESSRDLQAGEARLAVAPLLH